MFNHIKGVASGVNLSHFIQANAPLRGIGSTATTKTLCVFISEGRKGNISSTKMQSASISWFPISKFLSGVGVQVAVTWFLFDLLGCISMAWHGIGGSVVPLLSTLVFSLTFYFSTFPVISCFSMVYVGDGIRTNERICILDEGRVGWAGRYNFCLEQEIR